MGYFVCLTTDKILPFSISQKFEFDSDLRFKKESPIPEDVALFLAG